MNRRQFLKIAGTGLAGSFTNFQAKAEDTTLNIFLDSLRGVNYNWTPYFSNVPFLLRSELNTTAARSGKLLTTEAICKINSNVELKSRYVPDGQPQRVIRLVKAWRSITAQILAHQTLASLNQQLCSIYFSNPSVLYSDKNIFDKIVQIHRTYGTKGYDRVTINSSQAEELFLKYADKLNKHCAESGLSISVTKNSDTKYKDLLVFSRSIDDYNVDSWNICLNSTEDSYYDGKVKVVSSFCFNYNPENLLVTY